MNTQTFDNLNDLYKNAADLFLDLAEKSIQDHDKFVVALSGGSSPKPIFDLLATPEYAKKINWNKVYFFWVDERWVPLDDDQSNYKLISESLLDKININKSNIFPMYEKDVTPEIFAEKYESQIKSILGKNESFDFILLGMGGDGHTASLFPGEKVLDEKEKWVSAYYLESQKMFRITLTEPVINKAKYILVVTFGESKKQALKEVLYGAYNPKLYPLQLINKDKEGFKLFTDQKL